MWSEDDLWLHRTHGRYVVVSMYLLTPITFTPTIRTYYLLYLFLKVSHHDVTMNIVKLRSYGIFFQHFRLFHPLWFLGSDVSGAYVTKLLTA
jgi:hypothetical protein